MGIFTFLKFVYKMSDIWIKAEKKDSIPNRMGRGACPQVASSAVGKMGLPHMASRKSKNVCDEEWHVLNLA